MNLSKPLMAGVLAVTLGLPLLSSAQVAPQAPSAPLQGAQGTHRHHGMGMRMFKKLNLSSDQQTKIQSLLAQYRQAHPPGSTPDPEARKALRQQIDAALTPKQQAQLKEERENMRERRVKNASAPPSPVPQPT